VVWVLAVHTLLWVNSRWQRLDEIITTSFVLGEFQRRLHSQEAARERSTTERVGPYAKSADKVLPHKRHVAFLI